MKRLILILIAGLALVARAQTNRTDALSGLVQLLLTSESAAFQRDILRGISAGLEGRRTATMPAGWEAAAEKLSRSDDTDVRELARSLSVTFGSTNALATLRSTLLDGTAEGVVRSNALVRLLAVKDPELAPVLRELLSDPLLRVAAIRGLGAYDDPRTGPALIELLPKLPASEKHDALATLTARASYARALLAAVGEKRIAANSLTADVLRSLRALKDSQVDEQVKNIWGVTRETEPNKAVEVKRWKSVVQSKGFGDARQGRAVFARVCQQCHALFGEGGTVGPELTGHNRSDLDYVLQNIIDPNAIIPNDYRTWTVDTKDDRSLTGVVTKQDDKSVTVVTATETIVLPRKEVSAMSQSELSLMPEGLLQGLSEREVLNLLGYLRSTNQVPLPPNNK